MNQIRNRRFRIGNPSSGRTYEKLRDCKQKLSDLRENKKLRLATFTWFTLQTIVQNLTCLA